MFCVYTNIISNLATVSLSAIYTAISWSVNSVSSGMVGHSTRSLRLISIVPYGSMIRGSNLIDVSSVEMTEAFQ